jgi:integrase
VLRRALREAQIEGQLERNVASIARGVRIDADEGRTLTPDQARQLIDHIAGHRLEAAFTVALSLGLRLGELLGLAWPDVELDERPRITIRRALKRIPRRGLVLEDTKTASSRRTVYLPSTTTAALRSHRAAQAAERLQAGPEWTSLPLGADLVFRTPFGTAIDPNNFRHIVYTETDAAGVSRFSPHELRHSAASLLIAQGVPLKVISEMLGHSSIRITADVYGHLLEPAREDAAEAMERALWGQHA